MDGNITVGQLSVGEGLLEINNTRWPYVKVPISNHSKHEITLPKRTPLGTIQHVTKILETDVSQQAECTRAKAPAETNNVASSSNPPPRALDTACRHQSSKP